MNKKPTLSELNTPFPSVEGAWEHLRALTPPAIPQGMETRFWQRFETELAPLECERAETVDSVFQDCECQDVQGTVYPSTEEAWDHLQTMCPPSTSEGMESRFWQRFETELAPLEAHRQRVAANESHLPVERAPKPSFLTNWLESWQQMSGWFALSGTAAACLITLCFLPSPHSLTHHDEKANHTDKRDEIQHPLAKQTVIQLPTSSTLATLSPSKTKDSNESKGMYKHYKMLTQLELFEHLDSLEELSKKEGS